MFERLDRVFLTLMSAAIAFADPVVPVSSPRLVYATYVATGPDSVGRGLAVDSAGYAYVGGSGPGTGSSGCGFLTKLNQTGSAAVWSVCLPLAEIDAVAVDTAGYVYVAGLKTSYVYGTTVMKLSPDAQQIIYSTQIAGAFATSLVIDHAGDAYVSGACDATFKATSGAYMPAGGGAFAVKLNATGTVEYGTYLDLLSGYVAVDSKGQAWVVGNTCPTAAGPVGSNCDTTRYGYAAAIRKLDAAGAHLLVSKSFGGGPIERGIVLYDRALGVAVDTTDAIWVVGWSDDDQVPTTPGTIQPKRPSIQVVNGIGYGYAVKVSSSGDVLYGTYVGTVSRRTINSVAVDSQGRPYFALNAQDTVFPTSTVMVLSADASTVVSSTEVLSLVQSIAIDGSGGLYVSGYTSLGFFTTPGAYQAVYPGGTVSGYSAKFDLTTPKFFTVVNAASLSILPDSAVTPGEIVTLFGSNLPSNPKVTFDGRTAPILYADAKQINAVVPFEVIPVSTLVSLEGIHDYVLPVRSAAPALFTADGSGHGQLAALNQDQTVNSSTNPAKAGSVVAVYMTGVGAMMPPIADGQLGPLQPPYPTPVLGVSATVNGMDASILFAGQAPALIAGAVQVNIRIPAGTPSGNAGLVVYIGNYQTQIGGTMIAVQ